MSNSPDPSLIPDNVNIQVARERARLQLQHQEGVLADQNRANLDVAKYSPYLNPVFINEGLDEARAQNQSTLGLIGKGTARAASELVFGTFENLGYLADVEQHVNQLRGVEDEYANWFSETMREAKEGIREAAPVYLTKEAEGFAPWDGTWWATNAESIATTLSLLVPTAAAVKATSMLGKGLGAGKLITSPAGRTVAKGLAGATYSRIAENTLEARGTYDEVYNTLIARGTPEDQARQEAGAAASKTWNTNLVNFGTDFIQHMMLLRGTAGVGRASALTKAGNIAKQAGLEATEEAGQFFIQKEAANNALEGTDFFGKDFDNRLDEYIQDPDFATSAFLGAFGGAVFGGAGREIVNAASKGVEKLQEVFQSEEQRALTQSLNKLREETVGDIDSVRKIDDLIFTDMALRHIENNKGKRLKAELEELAYDPSVSPEDREVLNNRLQDIDILEKSWKELQKVGYLDNTDRKTILSTQIDYRQTATRKQQHANNVGTVANDVVQKGEIIPQFIGAKQAYHSYKAYENLAKQHPNDKAIQDRAAEAKRVYEQAIQTLKTVDSKLTDEQIQKGLVSSRDAELADSYKKLVAETERAEKLKDDLLVFSTPEGLSAHRQAKEQKAKNEWAKKVASDLTSSTEELKAAALATTDPEVKKKIEAQLTGKKQDQAKANETAVTKAKELKTTEAPQKAEKPKEDPSKAIPPPSVKDIPPIDVAPDIDVEIDVNTDYDIVFGPVDVDPKQVIIDRAASEQKTPKKSVEAPVKKQQEEAAPLAKIELDKVKTTLKELSGTDTNGVPLQTTYYYATDVKKENPIPITEVFESKNGILLINTPEVQIGDKVILVAEPEWAFFRSTDPKTMAINVYRTNDKGKPIGKPLAQIASSVNVSTRTPETVALRELVVKAKRLPAVITHKNFGDLKFERISATEKARNGLEVLTTDYFISDKGWKLDKTPFKPILGYISPARIVEVPNQSEIGLDALNQERLDNTDPKTNGAPGTIVTMRATPDGKFGFAQVEPRQLNKGEVEWLKSNLPQYLEEGQFPALKNIINIEQLDIGASILTVHSPKNPKLIWQAGDLIFPVAFGDKTGFIKISAAGKYAEEFKNFISKQPFKFKVFDTEGTENTILQESGTLNPTVLEGIYDSFDSLLDNQFKNINVKSLNSKLPYLDIISGKEYPTYFDYLNQTESITTDLPAGYSYWNATLYLDARSTNQAPITHEVTGTEIVQEVAPPPTVERPEGKTKKKIDWKKAADKGLEKKFSLRNPASGHKLMSQVELDWFKTKIGDQYLLVVRDVEDILVSGGRRAWGQYHDALVTLAQFAKQGTAYHEAYHLVFDLKFTPTQKKTLLDKARKEYKLPKASDLEIEEKMANEFANYMMTRGEQKSVVGALSNFFKSLLAYIQNLLGLRNEMERLFEDISNNGIDTQPNTPSGESRYRLVPGMQRATQQKQALTDATQRLIQLAINDAGPEGSYDDILENPQNLRTYLGTSSKPGTVLKQYLQERSNIQKQMQAIEDGLEASDEEIETLAVRNETIEIIIKNWDDIKVDEANVQNGFKSELIRNLREYGFSVAAIAADTKALTPITNPDEDPIQDQLMELLAADPKERVYGQDFFLRSPRLTLSGRLKRFLSTIPEIDAAGNPVLTFMGSPKLIDFNRVYSTLSSKLAGHKNLYSRLTELAATDPLIASVKTNLDIHIEKGQQSFDAVPAEFFTQFNRTKYGFVSILTGTDQGVPIARLIETDRRGIDRAIMTEWFNTSIRHKFINSSGEPNVKMATALLTELATTAKKKDATYEEVEALFRRTAKDVGIVLPNQVWDSMDKSSTRRQDIAKLTFGKNSPSLETFLIAARDGSNPFETSSGFLNILTAMAKDYVEDIQAGIFLNENNNQVNAINYPSYVSDLITDLTNPDTSKDKIDWFEQDSFYASGPWENFVLRSLRNPTHRASAKLKVFSAYRDKFAGDAKEHEDLVPATSFVSRLVAFTNNAPTGNYGYIYLGTLADKARQLMVSLPKYNGDNALHFLKLVLRGTVAQEAQRINRVKKGDSSILQIYKQGDQFHYIKSMNEVPGLADRFIDGALNPDDVIFQEGEVAQRIDAFIAEQKDLFIQKMFQLGIIRRAKGGFIENVKLPEALIKGRVTEKVLIDFFYNDLAWRMELSKLLHGDLATYKGTDDYFKRGYQIITPGFQGYVNPRIKSAGQKAILKRAVVQSSIKELTNEEMLGLAQLIDPKTTLADIENKSKTPAVQIARSYSKVNKTDAQGYISIQAKRDIMLSLGQWTNDHEALYNRVWLPGLTVNEALEDLPDEVKTFWKKLEEDTLLSPDKPFGYGDRLVEMPDGSSIIIKEQFKESWTVLLPALAKRHAGLAELLAAMNRDKIDVVSDSEAMKVGKTDVATDLSKPLTIKPVPIENLRFPQSAPQGESLEILAGTQGEKLIMGNILADTEYALPDGKPMKGKDLQASFHNIWAELITRDYKTLLPRLGVDDTLILPTEGPKRLEALQQLRGIVLEELQHRDLPDNYTDALFIVLDYLARPDFSIGFNFPALSTKYQQVLVSVFKKYVITQQLPGTSAANLADYGVRKSGELKFITNEKGQIKEAEIGLPYAFADKIGLGVTQIGLDGKIREESLTPNQKKALQMIIYRIPTQGKNSMLPVRVARILPRAMGNSIMVPGEGTVQGGFDFDFDKSYVMWRNLSLSGEVIASSDDVATAKTEELQNALFDIHWAVLTNKAHARELLNPINSKLHEDLVKEWAKEDIVQKQTLASPFSVTTDLDMEQLARYSKALIGIFSKFSVAHSTLQTLANYGRFAKVNVPILIRNKSEYLYDQLGRMFDDTGELISENHSVQQNSALDEQKDPKLGYLHITTFNGNVLGYMTDLGVNQRLALTFLNQPILRRLYENYFKLDSPNLEDAISATVAEQPAVFSSMMLERNRLTSLSDSNLTSGLTKGIIENIEHQVQVLKDFRTYFYAAADMAKVNTALSTDTFRDFSSLEAVEQYLELVDFTLGETSKVQLSSKIFNLAESPVKRVAAFFRLGVEASLRFTNQFFPYVSDAYGNVKKELAFQTLQRDEMFRDTSLLKKINQAIDFYSLQDDNQLNSLLAAKVPGIRERFSYFDPKRSIVQYLEKLKADIPEIQSNFLIRALGPDNQNRKEKTTQLLVLDNTHGNFNKTDLTNAWWDLMTSSNPRVRQFANDLAAYAVRTSGFAITPGGIVDLIPVQFWKDTSLAFYHAMLTKAYAANDKGINSAEAVRTIVRSLFTVKGLVPTVKLIQDEDKNWIGSAVNVKTLKGSPSHVIEFEALPSSTVFGKGSMDDRVSEWAKVYDRKLSKWRLYNRVPGTFIYSEIQPLGEPGRFAEMYYDGEHPSEHPAHLGLKTTTPKNTFLFEGGKEDSEVMDDITDELRAIHLIDEENNVVQTTADVVIPILRDRVTDTELKAVLDRLATVANKVSNLSIDIGALNEAKGMFDADLLGVVVDPSNVSSVRDFHEVLVHEILHAYSVKSLQNPVTPEEIEFRNTANSLFRFFSAKAKKDGFKHPAFEEVEEFFAYVGTNKKVQDYLRQQEGWWARFMRGLRRLLGLPAREVYSTMFDAFYRSVNTVTIEGGEGTFNLAAPIAETKTVFEKIKRTLKKRGERLKRTGQDYRGIESTLEKIEVLSEQDAVVAYLSNTVKELADLEATYNKNRGNLSGKQLNTIREQLSSYSVLQNIRNYIKENTDTFKPILTKDRNILEVLNSLIIQIKDLQEQIYADEVSHVAKWVKQTTSEDLSVEDIERQLDVADRDVTVINRYLDPLVDSRDPVLRSLGISVINAKHRAYRRTEALRKNWIDVNENYEAWLKTKNVKINDMKERNKFILDPDSFKADSTEILFIAPDSKEGKKILAMENGHPLKEYYKLVVVGYLASQSQIQGAHLRPGTRIPSIRRDSLEIISDEKGVNKLRVISEEMINSVRRNYDEADRIPTDEAGNPVDFVPVRYISKQDGKDGRMSTREVSLDVASTVFMFIDEMHSYEELVKLLPDLELAQDVLKNRRVAETKKIEGFEGLLSADRVPVVDSDGMLRTKDGITSNSYKQGEMFLKRMVFGQIKKEEGSATIMGVKVDFAKVLDSLMRYSGLRLMLANVNVATANIANGETTMIKEAIGGNLFTLNGYGWAKKKLFGFGREKGEIYSYLGDIGKRRPTSKLGILYAMFNPEEQLRGNPKIGIAKGRVRQLADIKTLGILNTIGNIDMNTTIMMAIMHDVRLTTPDGSTVSLYDAYEITPDGNAVIKPGLKYNGKDFSEEDYTFVRNKIVASTEKINGIYSIINSPGLRYTAAGRLLLFMRNWLKPGIDARWKLKNYNERLQTADEGYYVSAMNVLRNMWAPDGAFQLQLANLKFLIGGGMTADNLLSTREKTSLSAEEKEALVTLRRGNAKKFLFEMYVIAALSALATFGWDDDDDKDSFVLYHMVRLKRELSTFFSPSEAWSILKSPTVAMDTTDRFGKIVWSVLGGMATGEAFEEYESGPRKGEVRLWAQIKDYVPVWSQRHQFEGYDKRIELIERGWK